MQYLTDSGYTQSVQLARHPDVTLVIGYRHNVEGATREKSRYIIRALRPDGQWLEIADYVSDRDFVGALGDCDIEMLPDDRVAVGLAAGKANKNVQAALDFISGKLPPFSADASYNYSVSAIDAEARRIAQEAQHAAQDATRAASETLRAVQEAGRKAKQAAKAEVSAFIRQQQGTAVNAAPIEATAWSKAGDRNYAEAMNDQSPLMTRVWQKIGDRVYSEAMNDHSAISERARTHALVGLEAALHDANSPAGIALRTIIADAVRGALAARSTGS